MVIFPGFKCEWTSLPSESLFELVLKNDVLLSRKVQVVCFCDHVPIRLVCNSPLSHVLTGQRE